MSHFNYLSEFEKEFSKLQNKFRSLSEDIKKIERVIVGNPTGIGKNFVIIHNDENVKIVKARIMCRSLKNRSIRIIYAYHYNLFEFMYIEIYFKGDKEVEDKERIEKYLKNLKLEK